MSFVDYADIHFAYSIRGKLGLPNCLGLYRCGWSRYGYREPMDGIYQLRSTNKGRVPVKMRHYSQPNIGHPDSQAGRTVFAQGVQAWHNLTEEQKKEYNQLGKGARKLSGFCVFMSDYLKANL